MGGFTQENRNKLIEKLKEQKSNLTPLEKLQGVGGEINERIKFLETGEYGYGKNPKVFDFSSIEKMKSLYANIQGPDPDQGNPDGTLKDNAKGLYGLINEVTGPSVDDMFFLLMHNGVMNLPDSELGRIAFGYDRYLETQNAEAKDRAFWNKLGTFSGFMANKALPAIRNARGWDITRHAFAAYPSEFTRNSRDWIGEEKELMGIKIPGIPLFKRKKKRLLSTRLKYMITLMI